MYDHRNYNLCLIFEVDMRLTTMLATAGCFFLFTSIYMIFIYSRYDQIAGDEEGRLILLVISIIMMMSAFGFGGVYLYYI